MLESWCIFSILFEGESNLWSGEHWWFDTIWCIHPFNCVRAIRTEISSESIRASKEWRETNIRSQSHKGKGIKLVLNFCTLLKVHLLQTKDFFFFLHIVFLSWKETIIKLSSSLLVLNEVWPRNGQYFRWKVVKSSLYGESMKTLNGSHIASLSLKIVTVFWWVFFFYLAVVNSQALWCGKFSWYRDREVCDGSTTNFLLLHIQLLSVWLFSFQFPPLPPKPAIDPRDVVNKSKRQMGYKSNVLVPDPVHKDCMALQRWVIDTG